MPDLTLHTSPLIHLVENAYRLFHSFRYSLMILQIVMKWACIGRVFVGDLSRFDIELIGSIVYV